MKKFISPAKSLIILFSLLLITGNSHSQDLEAGFKNPPEPAKPRTWWHWTNSNITKEGITKDLEWMSRAGIGGFQLADVASGQGQTVDKKIVFGTPEWIDAVRHAAAEADRLKLEMTMFSSPGWSLTGGPWVKPEQAMKKLVWSEISLKGPQKFKGSLPPVPSNEGPIGNMGRASQPGQKEPNFSREFMILAFPEPADEIDINTLNPVITSSGGPVTSKELFDNDLNTSARIRAGKDKSIVWIQFTFEKPIEIKAVTMANRAGIPVGAIKAGNDVSDLKTLVNLPGAQLYRSGKVATYSFNPVLAKNFRIEFTGAPMRPNDVMAETTTRPDSVYVFSEINLHTGARINRWEDKAGFYHLFTYEPVESNAIPAASAIDPSSIVNLTALLQADGSIQWDVPKGNWTIMKFGYSLTGSKNRPAVPAGSGYEVDKLSREHSLSYIKDYTDPVLKALGPLYGKSMQYILLDSWEAGMQNWTDKMIDEFTIRRGYDPSPYLPCLAGRVIGNSDISDRFLWDFRRTLADMFAENHYKAITEYLHDQGIKTYSEASGVSLEILEDVLLCKKYVDIPMGEFWRGIMHPDLMYYQDVRGAASASHIYGKNIVATESFTGGGFDSPQALKETGDYWFTQGVNRIIFHTSAHQPLDTKPGNTMVGTHINRNITWAEQAAPFMNYLSRHSYMLQQGLFVADLVYLLNEGAPSTVPIWGRGLSPAPPEGYDYDYINADALLDRVSVAGSKLSLIDGMSYELLVLPEISKMTLPVLRKIQTLVAEGAWVSGRRPLTTPGLSGFPASEKEFNELVSYLWGDLDGVSRTQKAAGKGRVFWNVPLSEILLKKGIAKDLESNASAGHLSWIHRKTSNSDIYLVVNRTDTAADITLKFRISGYSPEIWDPLAGEIMPVGYNISGGKTIVPLQLNRRQALYIVMRNRTDVKSVTIAPPEPVILATIPGPWEIIFPEGLGAPEKAVLAGLESWTVNPVDGIKYFSGTATYRKTFTATKAMLQPGIKLVIDLGSVKDIAEVTVNGKSAGVLWNPPFRADISGMLKKGDNLLEVRVTNQWTNRLAGDQLADPANKVLKSTIRIFGGRGLSESGLLGPVTIQTE